MKKLYYGSMVLGLTVLALGSQVTSATTVLAEDVQTTQEGAKTPEVTTTENGAKSTHGTWEEANAKYASDLADFESYINTFNGDSTMLTHIKNRLAEQKAITPKDGKEFAKKFFMLRTLDMDIDEVIQCDVTVKNGDTVLTAKNAPIQEGNTAGHGDSFYTTFNSGTKNVVMDDGSKLDVEYNNDKDTNYIKKATLTDKDGKITDVPGTAISFNRSAGSKAADLLNWAHRAENDMKLLDQSNEAVQAAEKAMPAYINWLKTDGKASTSDEAIAKGQEYDQKYGNALPYAPTNKDVFPNPDGTTYVLNFDDITTKPTTDPNKGTSTGNTGNKDNNTTKPVTPTKDDNNKTDQPETKPTENKTIVAHKTVYVTSPTDDVYLYHEDGTQVKGRALGKNTSWAADKMMTLDGVKYLRVATDEWAKVSDGLEIESLNTTVTTNKQATLFTSTGKQVKSRALAANTPWRTDRSAIINGEKMYRVATNEWVSSADIQ